MSGIGNIEFVQPWYEYLPHGGGNVVSLFGAGGKTSLLGACARVYLQSGNMPVRFLWRVFEHEGLLG